MIELFLLMFSTIGFIAVIFFLNEKITKNILLVINPDGTGKLIKFGVKFDGKILSVKNNAWEVNDETTKITIDGAVGKKTMYIVSPHGIEPMKVKMNSIETQPIDPATFSKNIQNTLMRQILENAKSDSLNTKVILLLVMGIVVLALAYFLFVAPNTVGKDTAVAIAQAVANSTAG